MSEADKGPVSTLARECALRGDFWDLGMLSWIPVVLCGMLWLVFSAGIARDLPIVVIDNDNSTLSRQLTRWPTLRPALPWRRKWRPATKPCTACANARRLAIC